MRSFPLWFGTPVRCLRAAGDRTLVRGVPAALLLWAVGFAAIGAAGAVGAEELDFSRDIRPILSDKCFACHGPDDGQRQGGFRLDQRDSAVGMAESGNRPITPGDPAASSLISRILSPDPDLKMPPADSNKALTDAEIQLLRQWIAGGANYAEHWAFVPPRRPALPKVEHQSWPANPIDHFILARLERAGLKPSPEADKVTLLRRVTLDLTGLPPTPAEIDAFLGDTSEKAYENAVDRLLHSKRYGEHLARYWLDAARYGDTHGLHLDNYREIWPYRDWVINAFNRNLPYDQFAVQQLAGDLLPEPTLDQIVATGFNRCNVSTNEGGSIAEEVYVRNVVDRVVTFGTVFMGMTLECTRCHDHKFDPFTMNDFYSLFAYFNSIDGSPMDGNKKDHPPVLKVPTIRQQQLLAQHDQRIAALVEKLAQPWEEIDAAQRAWEESVLAEQAQAEQGNPPGLAADDWYTVGPFSDNQRYLFRKKHGPEGKPVDLQQLFKLDTGAEAKWTRRPEWVDGKPHTDLPGQTAANFLYRVIRAPEPRKVRVSLGSDDALKVYLNDKEVLAKDVSRAVAPDQEQLELSLNKGENHLLVKLMNYGGATGFYFKLDAPQPKIPADVLAALKVAPEARTDDHQRKLREHFRNAVADASALKQVQQELADLRKQRADVDRAIPTSLIYREASQPRTAYYLKRGEYDQRGHEVGRRTPSFLPPMAAELPNNRLGLARWLVSPEHPLTARVAVNRFWQQLFGTGLVKTAEDFGSQGQVPSHPELLDWLAVEFQDGWDVKQTLKRMVMSASYRQSSRVTPELLERDPENRLLARGPRFRLDAEVLRDQALAVSGLLDETIGGPGVKPPQPEGLWYAVGYSGSNTVRFVPDKDHSKIHRRSVYTFIKRTSPPPQMSILDGPSREACVVRRERTNTPLQALMLLNDPQFVEASRALASRALRDAETPAEIATALFRACLQRPPTAVEVDELVRGFQEDLATYRADPEATGKLLSVGSLPVDPKLPAPELAAWTIQANLLLNLDELLTKN